MFRFELWYDGCCLHEEGGFEEYDDAYDEGLATVSDYAEDLEVDEAEIELEVMMD